MAKRKNDSGDDRGNQIIKLDDIDHALQSGDFYIGQTVHTESPEVQRFVYDCTLKRMVFKTIQYPHGLLKIFDEGLVNAADNIKRGNGTNKIEVTLDSKKGVITIWNNGTNFNIVESIHDSRATWKDDKNNNNNPFRKAYQPEVAFFHCKTSTAYKKKRKVTGGKFGLGAKLLSIFSTWSEVQMSDGEKLFTQRSMNHMKHIDTPKLQKASKKHQKTPFIRISFCPDISLFYPQKQEKEDNITEKKQQPPQTGFNENIMAMFITRVFDISGTTKKGTHVTLKINDEPRFKVPVKGFKDYVKLFVPTDLVKDLNNKEEAENIPSIAYYKSDRWEVCLMKNPYPTQVSAFVAFANNINTYKGGEHVKYLYKQVQTFLQKKIDGVDSRRVQNAVFMFVNATIEDPSFNSQSKESLQTLPDQFGSKCSLPEARCLNVLLKNGVFADLQAAMKLKDVGSLRRSIGAGKNKSVNDIPHFIDARFAGTRKSKLTTLFIVEGVSALELAEVGLSVLGHDNYGAMAVKGKGINAAGSVKKVAANKEFQNICRAMGLQIGVECKREDLRYGKLAMLTDQDDDGSHIKGLIIYTFFIFWPHLLLESDFMYAVVTPIVVSIPASATNKKEKKEHTFYTLQAFNKWHDALSLKEQAKISTKYYKGLGTSTVKEGRKYFNNLAILMKRFRSAGKEDMESLDMVFNPKNTEQRKEWLSTYDPNNHLEYRMIRDLSYAELVENDIKHFFWSAMLRGIPKVQDGLTPSQRKCLYVFLTNNIVEELKVSQALSDVDKVTNYHHGQIYLGKAIVRMGQTFIGKQNVNVFFPGGQFGTRKDGGKVFSSERYIYTRLSKITRFIYRKEDDAILPSQTDEGKQIEPEYMAPIIPMVLVNGASNPAAGYVCRIACHKPEDMIRCIREKLTTGNTVLPGPWYHKFKGSITSEKRGSFSSTGLVHRVSPKVWLVTELPVRYWRNSYRDMLLKKIEKGLIAKFVEVHPGEGIGFEIHLKEELDIQNPLEFFNLSFGFNGQLNLFVRSDMDGDTRGIYTIKCYQSEQDIFDDYFKFRFHFYEKRRLHIISKLEQDVPFLLAKCNFIQSVCDKNGVITLGTKKNDLCKQMILLGISNEYHDKLLQMKITTFTKERILELQKQLSVCKENIVFYQNVSVNDMWNKDLSELEQELPEFWRERTVNINDL